MRVKKSSRDTYNAEQWFQDILGRYGCELNPTCNSGAKNEDCDLGSETLMVEIKSTAKSSYSIKTDLINNLRDRGYTRGKTPVLCVVTEATELKSANAFIVIPLEHAAPFLQTI